MAFIEERKTKDGKTKYRVQIRMKGYPKLTETFDRITDAKRWIQLTEAAMHEGRHFKTIEAKKKTLGDLIDRYIENVLPSKPKNAANQEAHLLWWKEKIGYLALADVTPSVIAELRDELLKGRTPRGDIRSPTTVVRYLSSLSHPFTVAINEWGWLEDNPVRKVSKPKQARGRVRFLDEDERKRLFEACRSSTNLLLFPVVQLAISTGMRQGEIMNLRWEQVDLDKRRIILYETKNDEIRNIPLTGPALKVIEQLKIERPFELGLLFPGVNPINPVDLRYPWEQAIKKSGITDFRFHDLRHCTASYLLMNGASLPVIAEILGHKTLQMVKRYAHLSEDHKRNVVEEMNQKYFGA